MRRFHAAAISEMEMQDVNAYVVVLAEQPDGSGVRLELQRAIEFDDQDRALGQDTYCLCTETGSCHYGGVTHWAVDDRLLRVLLDEQAARVLGVNDGFEIQISADQREVLSSALARVLEPTGGGLLT